MAADGGGACSARSWRCRRRPPRHRWYRSHRWRATVGPSAAPATNSGPLPGVYMVTDSVGLGAKDAVPAAFPGRTVVVDGHPALFVELLQDRLVRPRIASNPELFANGIAVVAGGYNYPYWDPARFDRSIDHMIATLRAAGAAHILWVTLREVKPQYITPSAWRQVAAVLLVLPDRQRPPARRAGPPSRPVARRLGRRRRSPRPDVRRDPPEHRRGGALRGHHRRSSRRREHSAGGRIRHPGAGRRDRQRTYRRRRRRRQPHRGQRPGCRLHHGLSVRARPTVHRQRQSRRGGDCQRRGDRRSRRRRPDLPLQQCAHGSCPRRAGLVLGRRRDRRRRAQPGLRFAPRWRPAMATDVAGRGRPRRRPGDALGRERGDPERHGDRADTPRLRDRLPVRRTATARRQPELRRRRDRAEHGGRRSRARSEGLHRHLAAGPRRGRCHRRLRRRRAGVDANAGTAARHP